MRQHSDGGRGSAEMLTAMVLTTQSVGEAEKVRLRQRIGHLRFPRGRDAPRVAKIRSCCSPHDHRGAKVLAILEAYGGL